MDTSGRGRVQGSLLEKLLKREVEDSPRGTSVRDRALARSMVYIAIEWNICIHQTGILTLDHCMANPCDRKPLI